MPKGESTVEDKAVKEIRASQVTVEVTDAATGRTFRRTLPIDYYENANCLCLAAENAHGESAQLVFYSGTGVGRLRDLTGGGPNSDPCGGHGGR